MSSQLKIKIYLLMAIGLFFILLMQKPREEIIKLRDHFLCQRISNKEKLANFLQSFKDDQYKKYSFFDQPFFYGYFNFQINEKEITEFFSKNPNLLESESSLQHHLKALLPQSAREGYSKNPINFDNYSIIYNEGTYVPIVIIPSATISLKEDHGERIVYTINSDLGDHPKYDLKIQKIKFTITKCGHHIRDSAYDYPRKKYLN